MLKNIRGNSRRLDPAFVYAETLSSWHLSRVECLSLAPGNLPLHQTQWSPERPLPTPQYQCLLRGTLSNSLRSPAQVEGTQGILPQPEKDLKSPSSTRLEDGFPYHDSRAMTRSPSPCAWTPDFPGATWEAPWAPRHTSWETPHWRRSSGKPTVIARLGTSFPAWPGEQSLVFSPNFTGGFTPFRPHNGLQEIPVATWEESRVLCFPSRRGLTSGESGMQPRDPCCPWRGTLCPGQKPRWGLFCPTVTREQHPSLPRNSNGRLVFTGPTQEEVWISRCNSRIPPQLLKTTWFPIHRNMRPLPATESQEKSHVSS